MIRLDYHRRATDRPRKPASLRRRTLDVLLMFVVVWTFVWLWTGAT